MTTADKILVRLPVPTRALSELQTLRHFPIQRMRRTIADRVVDKEKSNSAITSSPVQSCVERIERKRKAASRLKRCQKRSSYLIVATSKKAKPSTKQRATPQNKPQ